MKCWRYYLKPDKKDIELIEKLTEDGHLSMRDKYPLFGFTCDKKIKNEFEKIFNIDRFIKKTSTLTKEEYSEYAGRHRGRVLEMYELVGVVNHWKKNQKIFHVRVPVPFIGRQHMEDIAHPGFTSDYWLEGKENYIRPADVQNNSYLNALYGLGYVAAYNYYFDEIGIYDEQGFDTLGNIPRVQYNTFEWFVNEYQHILSNE